MRVVSKQRHRLVVATLVVACYLLITSTSVTAFATHSTVVSTVPPISLHITTGRRRRRAYQEENRLQNKISLEDDDADGGDRFHGGTAVALVGGQSLLVAAAIGVAMLAGTPNIGFGPGIAFSWDALQAGTLLAVPLGGLAAALDLMEDQYPALQDVTKATQRSVLAVMGSTFKPVIAFMIAVALGAAAGIGEEMLFRGVLQYEMASRFGTITGVATTSLVFGLLHSVTPLYAVLATIASVYFGAIYVLTDNLAIPIACHTMYDVGALFYAHWTVSQLPLSELKALADWGGPGSDKKSE